MCIRDRSCSVGDNDTAADNYTWIDSTTGHVIYHGDEWTIKPCSNTADDRATRMRDNCVTHIGGLMTMECHVTVGMTTAFKAVALYLIQPETTIFIATETLNS